MSRLNADLQGGDKLWRIRISVYSVISIGISAMALLGWALDQPHLRSLIPGAVGMNPLTAIFFILISICLLSLRFKDLYPYWKTTVQVSSAIVLAGSFARLSDLLGYSDFGFDKMIWSDKLLMGDPAGPNQMAPNTAFNFFLISFVPLLQLKENHVLRRNIAALLCALLYFISLISIIGYLYSVGEFYTVSIFIPMALPTAVSFLMLSGTLTYALKPVGIVEELNVKYHGVRLARRILPLVIVIPVACGYLRLWAHRNDLITVELGIASLVSVMMIMFFILVIIMMFSINRFEKKKIKAETELEKNNRNLELIVENRTKELQRADKVFKTLIETSNDGLHLLSSDMQVFYSSPGAERIHGFSKDELLNSGLLKMIAADSIEVFNQNLLQSHLEPEHPFILDMEIRHRNGKKVWVKTTIKNMLEDPEIKAVVVSFSDITEQKISQELTRRSERIYRQMASSIPEAALVLVDQQRKIVLISGRILNVLGIPATEVEGKKVEDFLTGNFNTILQHFQNAFSGVTAKDDFFFMGRNYILHFVPFPDESGNIEHVMMLAVDVTVLKSSLDEVERLNTGLELKVIERTRRLEETVQELEAFSYSVSHDLRGPLRAINGYTQILLEDYANSMHEDGKVYLNNIIYYSARMGDLIDDLLDFSRVGKKEMNITRVDLNHMFEQVWNNLSIEGKDKVDFRLSQLPVVYADFNLLSYVVGNLLSNAVKYSSRNPQPLVVVRSVNTDNGQAISVKDNGVGFDMKYYNKLFGVFNRLHDEGEFAGTGVGLAIVHRIVSRHNGWVWGYGEPDNGAEFFFTLGIHEQEEIQGEQQIEIQN